MISPSQDLRDLKTAELSRTGVLGLFQEPVCAKALGDRRNGVAHDARDQASDGFDDETGSNFPTGQHNIAN
jgi:hypothetical protein